MKYLLSILLLLACGKDEPGESKTKFKGRMDIYIHFDILLPKVLPLFEEECLKKFQDYVEPEKTDAIQDCLANKVNAILLYLEEAKKEYDDDTVP
jgi:hypothetical protein